MKTCPLCKAKRLTIESLVDHLVKDHSAERIAVEYLTALSATLPHARPCHKIGYPDEDTARAFVNKLLRESLKKNKYARQERRHYKCNICAYWHITKQERRDAGEYER